MQKKKKTVEMFVITKEEKKLKYLQFRLKKTRKKSGKIFAGVSGTRSASQSFSYWI